MMETANQGSKEYTAIMEEITERLSTNHEVTKIEENVK
jgi:hypothetical protein